jgi:hypothetical protein
MQIARNLPFVQRLQFGLNGAGCCLSGYRECSEPSCRYGFEHQANFARSTSDTISVVHGHGQHQTFNPLGALHENLDKA